MKNRKIVKNVFLLMSLTLISKFIGFIRELVMGYCYGATVHSDAYFTAYDIPKVLFSVIATAIATTFIPLYYKAKEERGEEGAVDFTNNIVNITLLLGALISVVAFVFMEPIVRVFAIGFKGAAFKETVLFARILLLGYIFSGLSSIMSSYLQSNEEFFVPGIIGIPFNAIVITGMILSAYFKNLYILPIGSALGLMSQYFVQIPKSRKFGYRFRFKIDLKDKYIREMLILVFPVLVSVSVTQINTVVDRTLASTLQVGSMSSLNYSNKLMGFFIGLFITTISIVVYPKLSDLSSKSNTEELNRLIRNSINVVFVLIMPIALGCIFFAKPIISLLFMRGAFDVNAAKLTSRALMFYSLGMIGLAGRTIITKIYYSVGDTKTPMYNSTIAVLLNIVLSIILVRPLKNGGIALSTSISYLVSMTLLMIKLKSKVGDYGVREVNMTVFKTTVTALLTVFISKIQFDLMIDFMGASKMTYLVALLCSVAVAAILYSITVYAIKIPEVKMLTEEFRSIINRKKK